MHQSKTNIIEFHTFIVTDPLPPPLHSTNQTCIESVPSMICYTRSCKAYCGGTDLQV